LLAPVIVVENARVLVPEVIADRASTCIGILAVLVRARLVAAGLAAPRDRPFQPVEQAVEVGRHDVGGPDRRERLPVGEPAGAEIPAALGGRANVAPKPFRLLAAGARFARHGDVLAPG